MNDTTKKDGPCKKCGATEGNRHLGYCFANPENNYRMPDSTKKDELFDHDFKSSIADANRRVSEHIEKEVEKRMGQLHGVDLVAALRSAHEKLEDKDIEIERLEIEVVKLKHELKIQVEHTETEAAFKRQNFKVVKELESQLQAKDAENAELRFLLTKYSTTEIAELTATIERMKPMYELALAFGKDCDHTDCGNQFDLISLRELMVCAKDAFKASQEEKNK